MYVGTKENYWSNNLPLCSEKRTWKKGQTSEYSAVGAGGDGVGDDGVVDGGISDGSFGFGGDSAGSGGPEN